jgi:predicted O-methyltransferase YrrM
MSFKSVNLLLRSNVSALVLLRYLGGRVSGLLLRVFPDQERAREVRAARLAFERDTREGLYSNTWFDGSIELWVKLLAPVKALGWPVQMLEIGSWEGRSSVFLLGYFPQGKLTVVDTWEGGVEYQQRAELATLEQRFDHNVSAFGDRLVKRKGLSSVVLSELASRERECFDFIFIDGSHFADDVMIDAVMAWRLLRNGGILVFDDYLWRLERYGWKKNPAQAINLFLRLVHGDHVLLHVGYHLAVRKCASLSRYLS